MPEMSPVIRLAMGITILALVAVIAVYHVVQDRQQQKKNGRSESEQPRRAA